MSEASEWKDHPCTKHLRERLNGERSYRIENWLNGNYTTETVDGTVQKNAQALGEMQVIDAVLEIIKNIEEDMDYAEPVRT